MKLSAIAAMDNKRVIGRRGALPWHLPADLRHFRQVTLGKPVIMGRVTYESIGKPLPGRRNIVVTRQPDYDAPGCAVVHSLEEALRAVTDAPEAVVIGGSKLYDQCLPVAQTLYLTVIEHEFEGDARFPDLDEAQWNIVSREDHGPDERNAYSYVFLVMERTGPPP